MKQYNEINPVKNLPDCYDKTPVKQNVDGSYSGSNNAKILENEKISLAELNVDMSDVLDSLDIEQATGETLNLYGAMLNQPRGVADDKQYRIMIKSKIAQNLSNGDYPSILNALCLTFSCNPSEIYLKQTDSGAIRLESLPLDAVSKAGFSALQVEALIQRLLPIGVPLESYELTGTFEFATDGEYANDESTGFFDTDGEYDETAGFTDENGIIGGYFGFISGEKDETILPI